MPTPAKTPNRTTSLLGEILTPEARDALKHLELFARRMAQGLLHGAHRSRRKGASTEFDHHKLYQPGDPLKHVDCKASARHDVYYVKRHVEDTALTVRIVVDRSASMLQDSGGASLYLQASRVAASLAYLILNQRDLAGLVLGSAEEVFWLPPRAVEAQLVRILQALASRGAAGADHLEFCLRSLVERGERLGVIAVISDFTFEPDGVRRQLSRLQAQGHEVILFQVRDPKEEEFPFSRWVRFRDRETPDREFRVDTVPLRRLSRGEYQALQAEWRAWARKYDIHLMSFLSSASVGAVLAEYMAFREGLLGKR